MTINGVSFEIAYISYENGPNSKIRLRCTPQQGIEIFNLVTSLNEVVIDLDGSRVYLEFPQIVVTMVANLADVYIFTEKCPEGW